MKYLLLATLFIVPSVANTSAYVEHLRKEHRMPALATCNSCPEVGVEGKSCVLRTECDPKLRSKDRELKKLKAQLKDLQAKIVILEKNEPKVVMHPPVIREYVVEVSNDVTKKSALSLIVPIANTKLAISESAGRFTAKTERETDLGLMYQRDVKPLRLSFGLATRGTLVLGAGIAF